MFKAIKYFFGFVAIVSIIGVATNGEFGKVAEVKPPPTPEEIAAKAKSEADFQRVVTVGRSVKASMRNPDSFKLVSALVMGDGTICITYRATNGFGGVVTEFASSRKDKISTLESQWNRYCGGKTGEDMSHARLAI